jgi:Flp pilus assembly pilin Flp
MILAARTSLSRPTWKNALALLADETGAIAAEYGLLAAMIALAVLGTLVEIRDALVGLPLQMIVDALTSVLS